MAATPARHAAPNVALAQFVTYVTSNKKPLPALITRFSPRARPMLFSSDRNKLRLIYVHAWHKRRLGLPMDALEHMIADVITIHPEYHALLADEEQALAFEESAERGISNPFLHLGMHISLREQISTDRPVGIRAAYEKLVRRTGDIMESEHRMIACLLRTLQDAGAQAPDEKIYLECIQRIL